MQVEELRKADMEKKIGTIKIDFEQMPFSIIGIYTPLSDFQLAYRLQQILGCEFEKTENFAVYKEKQKKEFAFDCIMHVDNCNGLAYMILPAVHKENKSVPLINSLKKIDYVLIVFGRDYKDVTMDICKAVKEVKNVVYANIFYPDGFGIKTKELKYNEISSISSDIEYFKDKNKALADIYI